MKNLDFSQKEIEKYSDRILSAFGLAMKAGKCVTGTELCVESIRKEQAKLVVAANDLSDNTKKKIKDSAVYHNVNCIFLDCSMNILASKLGKKCLVSCAAITDEGFVKIIEKIYAEIHTDNTEVQQ